MLGDQAVLGTGRSGRRIALVQRRALGPRAAAPRRPGRLRLSRVLSPAKLEPEHDYVAALVVPWRERRGGVDRGGGARDRAVPATRGVPHRRGGHASTTLALALTSADDDPVGTVRVTVTQAGEDHEVEVPGALTTLDFAVGADRRPATPPATTTSSPRRATDQGRRYVQPPAYGDAWVGPQTVRDDVEAARPQPDSAWPWTAQANADLRVRAIAGVGLQAGIDLQEQIVAAADRQWGDGRWTSDSGLVARARPGGRRGPVAPTAAAPTSRPG